MTIFVIVYLLALICYLLTRVAENRLLRIINKYLMATMYFVLAIIVFFKRYELISINTILLIALLFAYLGDLILVFNFMKGGISFLIGNIFFSIYEQIILYKNGYTLINTFWTFLIAIIAVYLFNRACIRKPNVFKINKDKPAILLYLLSILTHGLNGLCILIHLSEIRYTLLGMGSFLFMISDIILISYKYIFGENKWLVRTNSITYFVGMLLIVLSTIY